MGIIMYFSISEVFSGDSGTSNDCTPGGTKQRKRKHSKMGSMQNLYSDDTDDEFFKCKPILRKKKVVKKMRKKQ